MLYSVLLIDFTIKRTFYHVFKNTHYLKLLFLYKAKITSSFKPKIHRNSKFLYLCLFEGCLMYLFAAL